MDKTLKDLNLSTDEIGKLEKALKDPKFLELFAEYAKEIADPKAKAEQDLYLRQLESEGRAEEVYGKDTQLIVPEAAYVFRTKVVGSTEKVFVNVCYSEKVEPVQMRRATNNEGRSGHHFDIPLTLGPMKHGKDKAGQPCKVWDFVVHPNTLRMAQTNTSFRGLVAETAIERIEKVSLLNLSKATKETKMKYKAHNDADRPTVLGVRMPRDSSQQADSTPGARLKPVDPATSAPPKDTAAAPKVTDQTSSRAAARSQFNFQLPTRKASDSVQPKEPSQPGYRHPSGEETPKWELVHRGEVDLAASWGDAGRQLQLNTTCPKELVLRIELPGVISAAAVQLEVSCRMVVAWVPSRYRLEVALPFDVEDGLGKARFDKSRQRLDITMPVIPPPLPTPSPHHPLEQTDSSDLAPNASPAAAPDERPELAADGTASSAGPNQHTAAQPDTSADTSTNLTIEAAAAAAAAGTDSAEVLPEPCSLIQQHPDAPVVATLEPIQPTEDTHTEDCLSENQRKWAQLHAAAAAHSAAAVLQQQQQPLDEHSTTSAMGSIDGSQPEVPGDLRAITLGPLDRAVAAGTPSLIPAAQQGARTNSLAPQAADRLKTMRLEPRISCAMANDID